MAASRGTKYDVSVTTITGAEPLTTRGTMTLTEDKMADMRRESLRERGIVLKMDDGRQIWLQGAVFENTRLSFTPAKKKRRESTSGTEQEDDSQATVLGRGTVSGASSAREIVAPRRYIPPSTEDKITSFNGKHHAKR